MKDNIDNQQQQKEEGTLSVPASGVTKPTEESLQPERSGSEYVDTHVVDAGIHKKSPKELFLQKWNSTDKTCPTCHQITERTKGITKQNLKRLVWGPPNMQDWLTLFMMIGILMMAYLYHSETTECKAVIKNLDQICMDYEFSEKQTDLLNERLIESLNKTKEASIFGNLNISTTLPNE